MGKLLGTRTRSRAICILYALGIGSGLDLLDPGQLKFVYEHGREAFPTAAVLGWPGRMTDPAFGLDETMTRHYARGADLKAKMRGLSKRSKDL